MGFDPDPTECPETTTGGKFFVGSLTSDETTPSEVTIAGDPILTEEQLTAQCSMSPPT